MTFSVPIHTRLPGNESYFSHTALFSFFRNAAPDGSPHGRSHGTDGTYDGRHAHATTHDVRSAQTAQELTRSGRGRAVSGLPLAEGVGG